MIGNWKDIVVIKADDGKYYRNPEVIGNANGIKWLLKWTTHHPYAAIATQLWILDSMDFRSVVQGSGFMHLSGSFETKALVRWPATDRLVEANRFCVGIKAIIPSARIWKHDGVFLEQPEGFVIGVPSE